ncbi:M23 family metallopeptidase, partial [Salinibacter ruber]
IGDIDGGPLPVPMPQQPDPGFDPDPTDENEVCSNDPLKDMDIRATGCGDNASIEGGRHGDTRGPNNNQFHPGIDLLNDVGDPVYAAEGGVVSRVFSQEDGWGYYVIIQTGTLESGDTEWHVYAHLQEENRVNAENEEGGFVSVEAGDVIGYTGTSGNSDDDCSGGPPHLHYEVRQGDRPWTDKNEPDPVNPENHLGTEFSDSMGAAISDSCPSN